MNCKAINSRKIGLVLGCFSVIIMPQKTKKTALHKLLSADQADLELQPPERSRENSERALGSNFLFSGPKQNSNISNHRPINSLQSLVSLFLFRRPEYVGSVSTDESIALRLLGVPRKAAPALALSLNLRREDALPAIRQRLAAMSEQEWNSAVGPSAGVYWRVWKIMEGKEG
jgi:hypothetical protein